MDKDDILKRKIAPVTPYVPEVISPHEKSPKSFVTTGNSFWKACEAMKIPWFVQVDDTDRLICSITFFGHGHVMTLTLGQLFKMLFKVKWKFFFSTHLDDTNTKLAEAMSCLSMPFWVICYYRQKVFRKSAILIPSFCSMQAKPMSLSQI